MGIGDRVARFTQMLCTLGKREATAGRSGRRRGVRGGKRWPRALIREFGSSRCHEPRQHRPIWEQPMDAGNHSFRALCYWLYDPFGVVRPRGRSGRLRSDIDVPDNVRLNSRRIVASLLIYPN